MKCSRCENAARPKSRYCRSCHNSYMRQWRKNHPVLEAEALKRSRARSLFKNTARAWGIKPEQCEICGSKDKVEGHHEDYNFPMVVRWLCRLHHIQATNGYLALEPREQVRIVNPRWVEVISMDTQLPQEVVRIKLSRIILRKEREWIKNGRQGMFKSYPISIPDVLFA